MKEALDTMISKYALENEEQAYDALREILQEFILYSLSQTDFFNKAVFYGGTALRIFHSLPRFSEDFDFVFFVKIKTSI